MILSFLAGGGHPKHWSPRHRHQVPSGLSSILGGGAIQPDLFWKNQILKINLSKKLDSKYLSGSLDLASGHLCSQDHAACKPGEGNAVEDILEQRYD